MQITRAQNNFKPKQLGEYHDLYVQSNTLLLADAFSNFRNMCLEINWIDPVHILSALELAWQVALVSSQSKIRSFN